MGIDTIFYESMRPSLLMIRRTHLEKFSFIYFVFLSEFIDFLEFIYKFIKYIKKYIKIYIIKEFFFYKINMIKTIKLVCF